MPLKLRLVLNHEKNIFTDVLGKSTYSKSVRATERKEKRKRKGEKGKKSVRELMDLTNKRQRKREKISVERKSQSALQTKNDRSPILQKDVKFPTFAFKKMFTPFLSSIL